AWQASRAKAWRLHQWLADPAKFSEQHAAMLGLDRRLPAKRGPDAYRNRRDAAHRPQFEVHSVRPARRTTPDGEMRTDIIAVITQRRQLTMNGDQPVYLRGGCTLVLDRREDMPPIRYSIAMPVFSESRAE